jgi:hypothetical protein
MPDKHRKLPALGFAGFEDSPAAGGRRRKPTWPLNPLREPHAGEASDRARRLLSEPELLQGTGAEAGEGMTVWRPPQAPLGTPGGLGPSDQAAAGGGATPTKKIV